MRFYFNIYPYTYYYTRVTRIICNSMNYIHAPAPYITSHHITLQHEYTSQFTLCDSLSLIGNYHHMYMCTRYSFDVLFDRLCICVCLCMYFVFFCSLTIKKYILFHLEILCTFSISNYNCALCSSSHSAHKLYTPNKNG